MEFLDNEIRDPRNSENPDVEEVDKQLFAKVGLFLNDPRVAALVGPALLNSTEIEAATSPAASPQSSSSASPLVQHTNARSPSN
jgi:hypothetical protein